MPPSWKESHGHLPATIDPIQLAERGARLTGRLPLKGMARLTPNCLDDAGEVFVDLVFERGDGQEVFLLHGTLHAGLHVTCQRCLQGMDLALEAEPWFILAKSDASREALGEEADVLVADKPLSLSGLVEDELLLALPMVPMHEISKCPARVYVATGTDSGLKQAEEEKKSPFSVLSRLKKTR